MKIIFAVLLIAFGSFNLFAQSNVTKEQYAVYSAIMKGIYAGISKHDELEASFVIFENTVELNLEVLERNIKSQRIPDYLYGKAQPNNLTASIFEDLLKYLKEANKKPAKLDAKFPFAYKYSLISRDELDKNHTEYLGFSKVGFSPDGKFALVYFKTESGDHGSSTFYVLEKTDDKWEVRKSFGSSWIS